MMFGKNKLSVIFLVLIITWYLVILLIPYNNLAASLGIVKLNGGKSWPLSFFLMDILVILATITYIKLVIPFIKKGEIHWLLLGVSLLYPFITLWASLQDLVLAQ